ncbi:MAG: hypothetical protein ACC707_18665 [Thiohalomonadales bacterium]
MRKVVVVCPGGGTTGGIELLHQLVDSLTNCNCSTVICYYPFYKNHKIPNDYQKYRCAPIKYGEVDRENDVIILPEIYTYLVTRFRKAKVYVWWMSVDNYVNSSACKFAIKNMFLPWRYEDISSPKSHKRFAGHLYQSEYARQFLLNHGINIIHPLGDYVNEEYALRGRGVDCSKKKDIVVYNPNKGVERTYKLLPLLKNIDAVPIVGMARSQVIALLASAKLYIDFGDHPGKDRMPREAAVMGCCVITNRKGSASNSVDIPIGDKYKLDDECEDFETRAANVIHEVIGNYAEHTQYFDVYRSLIAKEKKMFDKHVSELKCVFKCDA